MHRVVTTLLLLLAMVLFISTASFAGDLASANTPAEVGQPCQSNDLSPPANVGIVTPAIVGATEQIVVMSSGSSSSSAPCSQMLLGGDPAAIPTRDSLAHLANKVGQSIRRHADFDSFVGRSHSFTSGVYRWRGYGPTMYCGNGPHSQAG